jgi:hypothetical protein
MRAVWLSADVLCAVATTVALVIAITGGGTFALNGVTVRAHSVGNLILALSLVAALRYALGRHAGLLGVAAWTPLAADRSASVFLQKARASLDALPYARAGRLALVLVAAATLVKAANAVVHPGFFSGDDVEIHEMTLGYALAKDWPVWDLRSAFYPMTFIYPIQQLLIWLGVTDVGALVISGRMVVVVLSSVAALLLFGGANRRYGPAIALTACACFALSRLQIDFGSTELPRPVSTLFVVTAFFLLLRPGGRRAALGGAAIGIAACVRFSEIVFVVPAVVQLVVDRRRQDALVFAAAVAASALAIQGLGDAWFWGEPFWSARAAFDYTLVERRSSRGYESVFHYLLFPTSWSNLLVLALAAVGFKRDWRAALWFALPFLALSAMPHKEPRYLIPAAPFLALLAAQGLWWVIDRLGATAVSTAPVAAYRFPVALALVVGLVLAALYEVDGYHVQRSDLDVERVRSQGPAAITGVPGTDLWRYGGRLYLER